MAKLHEYQGKKILREFKIATPNGELAQTPEEAKKAAGTIGKPVVIKAQTWITGRAAFGGIQFADTPDEAMYKAEQLLGKEVENFTIEDVLIEEKIGIDREFYAGIIIDDSAAKPLIIFSRIGGTGIEEIVKEHPDKVAEMHINIRQGLQDYQARNLIRQAGISGKLQMQIANILTKLYSAARKYEARSAEINPLVLTTDGKLMAADCRMTLDDYAVFRHPELGIEIAREFGHPPTLLEKTAYDVEKNDYRGTFYFIQMAQGFERGKGYVGFHGAGGGGSMMGMDALINAGFKIANFTDTSGNPSQNKVYRAARIILSQKNLDGYFGSGSGVASQEQFHSAYGLAKAFWEVELDIPAVIRLGGNSEDRAVRILEVACKDLPATVEGYKKDDSPDFCVNRFKELVENVKDQPKKEQLVKQSYTPPPNALVIQIADGTVYIDLDQCDDKTNAVIVDMCPGIMEIKDGKPHLIISEEEAASDRFTGWIGCEIECRMQANPAVYVDLPIEGLDN